MENNEIILTQNGSLTQEAMQAYVQGTLSAEKRADFEKILKLDPFAQEALEGMQNAPEKTAVPITIERLKSTIKEKSGLKDYKSKSLNIHWVNYAYAAAILGVLIGMSVIIIQFVNKSNDSLAEKVVVASEDTIQQPVIDSLSNVSSPSIAIDTTIHFDLALIANSITPTASLNKTNSQTFDTLSNNSLANVTTSNFDETKKEILEELRKRDATKINTEETHSFSTMKDEKVAIASAPVIAENKNNGVASDMVTASKAVEKPATDDKATSINPAYQTSETMYYSAISAYNSGSLNKAEDDFNTLIKRGQYLEGSSWYKANILLKKGKKHKAKSILEGIAKSNGSFKKEAEKLLENW